MTDTSRDAFETRTVHAGAEPDAATGAVVPAIQMSTTFKQDGVGRTRGGFEYGRSDNPTRRALEAAIASLESGSHGFAYASGLAATQNLLYLTDPGDRVVLSDDVYGGTWRPWTTPSGQARMSVALSSFRSMVRGREDGRQAWSTRLSRPPQPPESPNATSIRR